MLRQQGDVLIKTVDEVKGTKLSPDSRGYVLAEGENTGHYHGIMEVDKVEMFEDNGRLYLKVHEETELVHQEHNTIVLPKGDYAIDIVQEYNYFEQEARNVRD